jgi:hypothetical protein
MALSSKIMVIFYQNLYSFQINLLTPSGNLEIKHSQEKFSILSSSQALQGNWIF